MEACNLNDLNTQFDELKMNGNYEQMIKLLTENKDKLTRDGWDTKTLINSLNTIIKLHESL